MHWRRLVAITGSAVAVAALAFSLTLVRGVGAAPAISLGSSASFLHSCGPAAASFARCHAIVRADGSGPAARGGGHAGPSAYPTSCANPSNGYTPCDLVSAYKVSTPGSGVTIAIVDAFNDPTAASDLNVYRAQFGLPALNACGGASPWFCKVNQTGGTTYPKTNGGWAQEESLDVDMASALCSNCNILLVEATSNSNSNLYAADDYAATQASYISNSWSGGESSGETSSDSHFCKAGKVFVFATGDSGFGSQYPATSPCVTAAGGTHLVTASNSRGWSETAWSGAGSGCSSFEAQPSWQGAVVNITSVCARRAEADVSAVADPNTGVDVYDSTRFQGLAGWLVFGGTSVATPIIATVYGLASNASTVVPASNSGASYTYGHTSGLFDVTSGSNGSCGTDLCNATAGWDGPTGNGTPNGTGAF
jgi:subtilase family serine protease